MLLYAAGFTDLERIKAADDCLFCFREGSLEEAPLRPRDDSWTAEVEEHGFSKF